MAPPSAPYSVGQLPFSLLMGARGTVAGSVNMVPLLLTQAIILFQDTSLVYVSALADFFGAAYKVGDRDGRLVELLLFAGLVYFVICFAASSLVKRLQKKYQPA